MKEWRNVCLFIVSDHGTSGEVKVLPLLTSGALLNTCACGIGHSGLQGIWGCASTLCWYSFPPVVRISLPRGSPMHLVAQGRMQSYEGQERSSQDT